MKQFDTRHPVALPGKSRICETLCRTIHRSATILSSLSVCLWVGILAIMGAATWLVSATAPTADESLAEIAVRGESDCNGVVIIKARARVADGDPFGVVSTDAAMKDITFYRTTRPSCNWALICGDHAIIADGSRQFNYHKGELISTDYAVAQPQFGLLGHFLWGSVMIDVDVCRSWQGHLTLQSRPVTDARGFPKVHYTVEPSRTAPHLSSSPGVFDIGWFNLDYTKNYLFDVRTGRLEKASVTAPTPAGPRLLFETQSFEYLPSADALDQALMEGV